MREEEVRDRGEEDRKLRVRGDSLLVSHEQKTTKKNTLKGHEMKGNLGALKVHRDLFPSASLQFFLAQFSASESQLVVKKMKKKMQQIKITRFLF